MIEALQSADAGFRLEAAVFLLAGEPGHDRALLSMRFSKRSEIRRKAAISGVSSLPGSDSHPGARSSR